MMERYVTLDSWAGQSGKMKAFKLNRTLSQDPIDRSSAGVTAGVTAGACIKNACYGTSVTGDAALSFEHVFTVLLQ